jgi:very-short-patch-repair endonuclease
MTLRANCKPWKRKLAAKMSRNKSWPEKILWARLRDKQLGVVIVAQSVILGWIADFYCPSAKLVIEVDGPHHLFPERIISDKHRDLVIGKKGIKTIRFTAQAVQNNTAAVVAMIEHEIFLRNRK